MAIGNTHRKVGKDRAFPEISWWTDRQTHRQTCSSQYFATDPEDEIIMKV